MDLAPDALIARTAIHVEEKGYGDDVGIIFRRAPRIFRLVGLDGRETGDAYGRWQEAFAAESGLPSTFAAISIDNGVPDHSYWRTPWGFHFYVPEVGPDKRTPEQALYEVLADIAKSRSESSES